MMGKQTKKNTDTVSSLKAFESKHSKKYERPVKRLQLTGMTVVISFWTLCINAACNVAQFAVSLSF